MAKKKNSPLDELESRSRVITARTLKGEQKELWNEFVIRWQEGRYDGISQRELFEWAKQTFGLNCSASAFRNDLVAGPKE